MGKAKSMNVLENDKVNLERHESSDDYAITGEFLQNTVFYKSEPKLINKHSTSQLEYPNLNSVEAYHCNT